MVLDSLRTHASSWLIKVVFAIIILVFIFWGIGSYDSSSNNVAKIDGTPISTAAFRHRLQMAEEQMKRSQGAQQPENYFDILQKAVFKSMVNEMIIDSTARKLSIMVSDDELRQAISSMPQFQDGDGTFSPDKYKDFVMGTRQSMGDFEAQIRREMLQTKMLEYVTAAVKVTESEARGYYDSLQEHRAVDYRVFDWGDEAVKMRASIDDAAGQAFYQANQVLFSSPPKARLEYVLVSPAELSAISNFTITGQQIEDYYNANSDEFKLKAGADITSILFPLPDKAGTEAIEPMQKRVEGIVDELNAGVFAADPEKALSKQHQAVVLPVGWQDFENMPQTVQEMLRALKPGQYSKPMATPYGVQVIKVNGFRDDKAIDLDEASPRISGILAERRASERMSSVLEETMDNLLGGIDLKTAAAEAGLEVRTTGLLNSEELSKELALTDPKDMRMIFDTPKGLPVEQPISTPDGYILAVVADAAPQTPLPYEQVADKAKALAAEEAAGNKARQQAIDFINAGRQAGGLTESPLFGRQGQEGLSTEMVSAAFEVNDVGTWLPEPYAVDRGFVVARLAKRVPPKEGDWQQEKEGWIFALENQEKNLFYNNFINALLSRAKVEVYHKPLLE